MYINELLEILGPGALIFIAISLIILIIGIAIILEFFTLCKNVNKSINQNETIIILLKEENEKLRTICENSKQKNEAPEFIES